jgi:hypothetical protein
MSITKSSVRKYMLQTESTEYDFLVQVPDPSSTIKADDVLGLIVGKLTRCHERKVSSTSGGGLWLAGLITTTLISTITATTSLTSRRNVQYKYG